MGTSNFFVPRRNTLKGHIFQIMNRNAARDAPPDGSFCLTFLLERREGRRGEREREGRRGGRETGGDDRGTTTPH